jgi:hypothetical protein
MVNEVNCYEPDFTEEEFETLYSKLFRNSSMAGLFDEFIDKEDLKNKLSIYVDNIKNSSSNQGYYRDVDNATELRDAKLMYDVLFGKITNLPLQINRGFIEAAKYRLKIGK